MDFFHCIFMHNLVTRLNAQGNGIKYSSEIMERKKPQRNYFLEWTNCSNQRFPTGGNGLWNMVIRIGGLKAWQTSLPFIRSCKFQHRFKLLCIAYWIIVACPMFVDMDTFAGGNERESKINVFRFILPHSWVSTVFVHRNVVYSIIMKTNNHYFPQKI